MKDETLLLFILLVLTAGLLGYILQNFIASENLWIDHYEKMNLRNGEIYSLMSFQEKWSWITFIVIPLIYFLKLTGIAMWIMCGVIISGYNISFSELFKRILLVEFIWLLPQLLSVIWFGLVESPISISQIENFGDISLIDIVNPDNLENWIVSPLKSLNLIHVLYIILLANQLRKIMDFGYGQVLKFTIVVYGSAVFVWTFFYSFISVNSL